MANIRVIPIGNDNQGVEDLAVANAAVAIFPKDSMWVHNANGDLTVSSIITGRSGSWISKFNLNTVDNPPLIEWVYSPEVDNEVIIPAKNFHLRVGEFYDVKIISASEYDLIGEVLK